MSPVVSLEYRHVDVFSRYGLGGNGLVVMLTSDGLSTDLQQQLTREVRQFESVFVSKIDFTTRTARLRIFTEDEELRFAGHPVLGAAAVLHTLLPAAPVDQVTWTLSLGARRVLTRTVAGDGWVDAAMDQGPAEWGRVVSGELADRCRRALRLPAGAIHTDLPMQVVSTGLPYLIVPVQPEALLMARIGHPSFGALLAECGAAFVYVLDPAAPEGRTWDNAGRVEDVATGSAAGPAAEYLFGHRVHPADVSLQIAQGRFVGRPSVMEVRRDAGNRHMLVGGPVAAVAAGRIETRVAPRPNAAASPQRQAGP